MNQFKARFKRKPSALEQIRQTVSQYVDTPTEDLEQRLHRLESEWDTARVIKTNASILAGVGLLMGLFGDKKWLLLPGALAPLLMKKNKSHYLERPLKMLGIRSKREIEAEMKALEFLRQAT